MNERVSSVKPLTVALLVTIFLISIEATVVSTAASKIVSDLGGLELMGWIFSIYLLTTVVSTPIFGKLLDLYGRKMIFLIGLTIFVAASALAGLAGSMPQLIIFRALQGIGAGALFPAIMTIVGVLYSEQQRAKMQAGFSAVGAISGLAGPFIGDLNELLGAQHSPHLSAEALGAIRHGLGGSISQLFLYILIFSAASFIMVILLPRSKRQNAEGEERK